MVVWNNLILGITLLGVVTAGCGGAADEPCDPVALTQEGDPGGGMTLEYVAKLEDERLLVVIRPSEDWDYDDFRLFLGSQERLEERSVYEVTRHKDGGTTTVEFDFDGTRTEAFFPAPSSTADTAHLTRAGERSELTQLEAVTESLGDAEFMCQ
jgi:hypothetical protein